MESGGAEMVRQTDHLMRTCHQAQFAGFTPLFINFYSWHINSLPGGLNPRGKFDLLQESNKQCLTRIRNLRLESKQICYSFHKVVPSLGDSVQPAFILSALKGETQNNPGNRQKIAQE